MLELLIAKWLLVPCGVSGDPILFDCHSVLPVMTGWSYLVITVGLLASRELV